MPVFTLRFEDAETRQVDIGFVLCVKRITHRPAHVGLPSTQPDFADRNILELDAVASGNSQ